MLTASFAPAPNHVPQLQAANFLNLLVLDDDSAIRDASCDVARSLGFSTHVAGSAEQAYRMLDSQSIDAVLLEFRPVGNDGLQALHMIKQQRPDAVIIVLAGYGTVQSAVQAMRNGAFDYVTKPLSMEELRLLLGRVA